LQEKKVVRTATDNNNLVTEPYLIIT